MDRQSSCDAVATIAYLLMLTVAMSDYTVAKQPGLYVPARGFASAGTSYDPVSVCVCLSVCLSVTSRSSIEMVERIELAYGTGASFGLTIFRYL